ncbi:hypothetical protein CF327_g7780 [Tilletia walkeri]|uniref:Peptidase A1 domain-containing protein n=1 Tax=Tilletia walkeri TaxID=117179 RepID=A0A8X7N057_9BASI|nr:hypothetical protein CF327_g7780 [Tilletia walkeri]KAE8260465.1 hypothetical protein A4X09_0g7766 [Tilletia walkeri]
MPQRSLFTTVVLALSLGSVLATHQAEIRGGMNQHRGLDTQAFKKQVARGNTGATANLVMEDHSPMLPRITLPIQLGSQGQTANVYLAGMNADCVLSTGSYDPSKSSTAHNSHAAFDNGLGGPAKGEIWTDNIKVAGLSVQTVSLGSLDSVYSSGQCGIAWSDPTNSFFGDGYQSFLYSMKKSGVLQPPNFSIQYSLHGQSTIAFGSAVPSVSGSWIPSDPEAPGYWTIQSKIASVASYMIVDPSAFVILGNTQDIQEIFDHYGVGKNTFRDEYGYLGATFPCNNPPKVVINVGGLDVPLTKEVMTFGKDAKGNCLMPLQGGDDYQSPVTLGSPFLASIKSIVFNIDTHAMHIVPL